MGARFATIVIAALLPAAAGAQAPQPGLSGFRWFAELAGHCYKGEHPGSKATDTQCYQTQYGQYMRGTIHMATQREGATVALDGDSVFHWDAKAGRIQYTQWATNGRVGYGETYFDGDLLRFPDRPRDGEVRGRMSWERLDADSYRVTREVPEGDAWKPTFSVTYRRVP